MPKLPCQWRANKIIINKKNSNKKMIKISPRFLHSSIKKEAANGLLLTLWLLVLMRRKSQRLHLLPTMKTKRQKEEKEEYQLPAILGLSFPVQKIISNNHYMVLLKGSASRVNSCKEQHNLVWPTSSNSTQNG